MTETTAKMSTKIDRDLGINALAGEHYSRGKDYTFPAVVMMRVKQISDGDKGFGVQYILDRIEVAGSEHASQVTDMLGELYRLRTSGSTLPFEGTPEHEQYRLDRLKKAVTEWQAENEVSDLELGQRWVATFGDEFTPVGPLKGVSWVHLYEFALEQGVISGDQSQDSLFRDAPEGEAEAPSTLDAAADAPGWVTGTEDATTVMDAPPAAYFSETGDGLGGDAAEAAATEPLAAEPAKTRKRNG